VEEKDYMSALVDAMIDNLKERNKHPEECKCEIHYLSSPEDIDKIFNGEVK